MTKNKQDNSYAVFSSNNQLIKRMESLGKPVFSIPEPKTQRVELTTEKRDLIKNITDFDWIVFVDVLTVDFFVEALVENEVDLFDLDLLRVCSFGEAVSDRLRFSSLHTDLIPDSFGVEKVIKAILVYEATDKLAGLNFLIPKREGEDLELKKQLREIGAEVSELPVYSLKKGKDLESAKIKALLNVGAIDEFILSKPEELILLKSILPDFEQKKLFTEIEISAVDELLAQYLRENGFEADMFREEKY